MCRLYGFLATDETRLECSLVEAQNALVVQSDRDLGGKRNADGWGVADWSQDLPRVTRNTYPAFAERSFVEFASTVASRAVIAHVRSATVGAVALENTHPFDYGPWAFAHNGSIPHIEHIGTHLDLGLHGPLWGETDSELVFRWILNRMSRYGLDPEEPAQDLESIVALMADAVTDLVRISLAAGAQKPPQLTFVIGDGRHLVASRWGNPLYWIFRRGISDCVICKSSHCPQADETYKAVVIASEPITNEQWLEIPEGTVLGVDTDLSTMSRSLVDDPSVAAGY